MMSVSDISWILASYTFYIYIWEMVLRYNLPFFFFSFIFLYI